MSALYIIRGLPGAGKSTLAREIKERTGADHWEADQYFVNDGVYQFDGSKIGEAHVQCETNFVESLRSNRDVVVSNTFTRFHEFIGYIVSAQEAKYDIMIIECLENYGSLHNVPEIALERMRSRWIPNSLLKEADLLVEVDWDDIHIFNQEEFQLYSSLVKL
jgi:predicted ABC-type ATPase